MHLRCNLIELWNWRNGPSIELDSPFTIKKAKTILICHHLFTLYY